MIEPTDYEGYSGTHNRANCGLDFLPDVGDLYCYENDDGVRLEITYADDVLTINTWARTFDGVVPLEIDEIVLALTLAKFKGWTLDSVYCISKENEYIELNPFIADYV